MVNGVDGGSQTRHLGRAALVAATAAVAVFTWLARCGFIDDAFIYACSVRSMLEGGNLSFHGDAPVNSLSSPLWSWLLVLAAWLGGSVLGAAAAVSGLCLLAAGWCWAAALAALGGRWTTWAPLAFLFLAASRFGYLTLGMETPLLLATLGATALAMVRGRRWQVLLAAAAVCATRPEMLLLVGPGLALWLWRHRGWSRLPRDLLAPLALAGVLLALQWWQFGHVLPTTLRAKMAHTTAGLGSPFWQVADQLTWFFDGDRVRLFAVLALAGAGAVWLRRNRWSLAALCGLVLLTGFYLAAGLSHYHWYYAPHYLALWVYGTAGAMALAGGIRRLARPMSRRIGGILLAAALVHIVLLGGIGTARYASDARPPWYYQGIGLWLRQFAPPGATVALAEIGTVGWYSQLPVVDMMGLATPGVIPFLERRDFTGWWREFRPDLVVAHDPFWPVEAGIREALASGEYHVVPEAQMPGFQLLRRSR